MMLNDPGNETKIVGSIVSSRDWDTKEVLGVTLVRAKTKTGEIIRELEIDVSFLEEHASGVIKRIRRISDEDILQGLILNTGENPSDLNFDYLSWQNQILKVGLGEIMFCCMIAEYHQKSKEDMIKILQKTMVTGEWLLRDAYFWVSDEHNEVDFEQFLTRFNEVCAKKLAEFKSIKIKEWENPKLFKHKRTCAYAFSSEHEAWLSEVWDFMEDRYLPILRCVSGLSKIR